MASPELGAGDVAAIRVFWRAYQARRAEVQAAIREAARAIPAFAPVMAALSEEELDRRDREAVVRERAAVEEGDWHPWRAYLRREGEAYAHAGIPFDAWHALLHAFRAALLPIVLAHARERPDEAELAIAGLMRYLAQVLEVLSSAYLAAKESIIAAQAARLDAVVRQMPAGVMVLDVASGQVVLQNRLVDELIGGGRAEEARGFRPDGTEYGPDEWPLVRAARRGEEIRGEVIELLSTHGDRRTLAVSAAPVRAADGTIVDAVVVFDDLTEERRAERALQRALADRAEALARSNRDLERFAYVASHDLQEPLRMVSAYTELLARRYRNRVLDDTALEYVRFAVDGARRMSALLGALLEYSRIDAGPADHGSVDLGDVLRGVLADLRGVIAEAHATVDVGPLPVLPGDPTLLRQLFQNLVGNALKFRGGRPASVRVRAERDDTRWHVTVADQGVGFDLSRAPRLFEIFQRGPDAREYPGTGVGLAICKRVVERHGGDIRVESAPGAGTTVHVLLPA